MSISDDEYAEYAARHGFGTDDAPRQDVNPKTGLSRQEEWAAQGINSFDDAKAFILELRTSRETSGYLGLDGREAFANDVLNAIHRANANDPERSTAYINSDSDLTATQRLSISAQAERRDAEVRGIEAPCVIREGGSQALEQDRAPLSREEAMAASKQAFLERGMNEKYQDQQQAVEQGQGHETAAGRSTDYAPSFDMGEPASDMSREDRMAASKEEFLGRNESEQDAPSVDVERGGGIERG